MTCPEYCGEACVDGRCPLGSDYFEGEPITCDSCWYYKDCEACLDDECNERK